MVCNGEPARGLVCRQLPDTRPAIVLSPASL